MYSREQLIEKSKVYFENNDIESILAVSDGNFFYTPSGRNDAMNHVKSNKSLELIEIKKVDVFGEEVEPKLSPLDELMKNTKKELLELASKKDIEADPNLTKKEICNLILG